MLGGCIQKTHKIGAKLGKVTQGVVGGAEERSTGRNGVVNLITDIQKERETEKKVFFCHPLSLVFRKLLVLG